MSSHDESSTAVTVMPSPQSTLVTSRVSQVPYSVISSSPTVEQLFLPEPVTGLDLSDSPVVTAPILYISFPKLLGKCGGKASEYK